MICESNHLLMGGGFCIYWIHPGLLDLSLISFFSSGFARAGSSARAREDGEAAETAFRALFRLNRDEPGRLRYPESPGMWCSTTSIIMKASEWYTSRIVQQPVWFHGVNLILSSISFECCVGVALKARQGMGVDGLFVVDRDICKEFLRYRG